MKLEILPGWEIAPDALSFRAVASSGPGGQNVNKVATKVQLRFKVAECTALDEGQKQRFVSAFRGQINHHGELLISCDETRSLAMNKERALGRLRAMILGVRFAPRLRHKTRPTRGSRERRLAAKKARGQLKQGRRASFD